LAKSKVLAYFSERFRQHKEVSTVFPCVDFKISLDSRQFLPLGISVRKAISFNAANPILIHLRTQFGLDYLACLRQQFVSVVINVNYFCISFHLFR